jgi:hypothetical protein
MSQEKESSQAWSPAPGSHASRAIELLESMPAGTALPTAELAKELGIAITSVQSGMATAVKHRLLFREQRNGRWVYTLDASGQPDDGDDDKHPVRRTVRASDTKALPGLSSVFGLAGSPEIDAAPALPDEPTQPQEQTTPATRGLNWRPPKRSQAASPPPATSKAPFRCALWSTGELVLCIGDAEPLVLDRDKTTALVNYLDRMAVEPTTEIS